MMPSVRPAGPRIALELMSSSHTASDAARMHAPINTTKARDIRTPPEQLDGAGRSVGRSAHRVEREPRAGDQRRELLPRRCDREDVLAIALDAHTRDSAAPARPATTRVARTRAFPQLNAHQAAPDSVPPDATPRPRRRDTALRYPYGPRREAARTNGARRAWTVSMISALSMPPRAHAGAASCSPGRDSEQALLARSRRMWSVSTARSRLARAGRSGRGCRRRACRGCGRRGP